MRLKRNLALSCVALLAVAALRGQSLSPDELRLGSRPYVPPDTTFRVQTNLVEVRVVVRDSKGQPVAGLQQNDFELFDNGKPQTISVFSVEPLATRASAPAAAAAPSAAGGPAPAPAASSAEPRYIALFFDDLNMPMGDLTLARKAAQSFVSSHLDPGSRVAVFTSSSTVTLEPTADARKLFDALAQLRSHLQRADEGASSCPPINPYQAYMIIELHDSDALDFGIEQGVVLGCLRGLRRADQIAIVKNQSSTTLSLTDQLSQATLGALENVIQYLGKMPGRRTVLLASSGFLAKTAVVRRRQEAIMDAALHANVVINALDAKGIVAEVAGGYSADRRLIPLPGRPDLMAMAERMQIAQRNTVNDPMALLSQGTGGRFFYNNNDLDRGVRDMASAPELSYLLGFSPDGVKPDGRYHNLKVKLAGRQNLSLEARRGYYAPDNSKPAQPGLSEKFDAAVLASSTITDIRADITARSDRLDSGEPVLRVVLRVDARSLPFERRGARHMEKLRFVLALFDTQGKFLIGLDGAMDLNLKDDTLARLTAQGLSQGLSLQAPPGSYKLRVVLVELINGKMAALTRPVEIR